MKAKLLPEIPPPDISRFLIGSHPSETITNCTSAFRFLGQSIAYITEGGIAMDPSDGLVVSNIMTMISEVLEWEAERLMSPKIKTESD